MKSGREKEWKFKTLASWYKKRHNLFERETDNWVKEIQIANKGIGTSSNTERVPFFFPFA